jgi:hypothetical protein
MISKRSKRKIAKQKKEEEAFAEDLFLISLGIAAAAYFAKEMSNHLKSSEDAQSTTVSKISGTTERSKSSD